MIRKRSNGAVLTRLESMPDVLYNKVIAEGCRSG